MNMDTSMKNENHSEEIKSEKKKANEEASTKLSRSSSLSLLQTRSGRCVKYNSDYLEKNMRKRERQSLITQVKKALDRKDRTQDDLDLLKNYQDLVEQVNITNRNKINAAQHQEIVIDDDENLERKCKEMANAIFNSKHCVVYTGAGISTSASIPDYRGPKGLWTMLEKGIKIDMPDFSLVDPSYSHMVLSSMMKQDLVKYIVSQNCDGLHLRSGIDLEKLSELHGNCFVEFCSDVECNQYYIREFDVTEKTSFRKHSTGRNCKECLKNTKSEGNEDEMNKTQLRDSIIHFGEKLRNGHPYRWETAKEAVKNADMIICLGTSLKVLKHYACLWPKKISTLLYIVNIQWTPKDKQAKLKINGYCDDVLKLVVKYLHEIHKMKSLKVNAYNIYTDPLFKFSTKLTKSELDTTTKLFLTDRLSKSFEIIKRDDLDSKQEKKADNDADVNNKKQSQINSNSWYNRSFKSKSIKLTKSLLNKPELSTNGE